MSNTPVVRSFRHCRNTMIRGRRRGHDVDSASTLCGRRATSPHKRRLHQWRDRGPWTATRAPKSAPLPPIYGLEETSVDEHRHQASDSVASFHSTTNETLTMIENTRCINARPIEQQREFVAPPDFFAELTIHAMRWRRQGRALLPRTTRG